jgi:hypothetical protein
MLMDQNITVLCGHLYSVGEKKKTGLSVTTLSMIVKTIMSLKKMQISAEDIRLLF